MTFHASVFHNSVAAGSGLTALNPINDDVLAIENNAIVCSSKNSIFAGLGMGDSLNRARISTPTLNSLAAPFLRPIISQSSVPTNPNVAEWLDSSVEVAPGEGVSAEAVHDSGLTQNLYVLLWFANEFEPAPEGAVLTIRGTGTTAVSANAWTDVAITWDSPLAHGHYAVVASECISTNALAFRWKFDTQGYRPGGISQMTIGGRSHPYFSRPGKLGIWGHISAQVMPRLQVLSTGASSSHTVFLQVIRIGD